jgi:hypothetical protein
LKSQHLKFSTCCCFVDVIVSMEWAAHGLPLNCVS